MGWATVWKGQGCGKGWGVAWKGLGLFSEGFWGGVNNITYLPC